MTYQLQASIPYFTAIPEDVVTNVFHFDWTDVGDPGAGDWTAMNDMVANFYETIHTATCPMAAWMRPLLTRMKIYDLVDATPRAPRSDVIVPLTVTSTSAPTTPPEAAIVASFQGDPQSGFPQASRRGRVYIGGLGAAFAPGSTSSFAEINSATRTLICAAMEGLRDAVATTNWQWVVRSRALSVSTPVTNGWVDNAFDTQRRRGNSASARTLWS